MRCPKCGTTNGKTNRYCRECGLRLDGVRDDQAQARDRVAVESDEVTLGEELFEVWELLNSGDLDSALDKGEQMLAANPDSASAHSLVGLIYERKAERELLEGRVTSGHQFLKFAVAQYERIIDLNPDSTADREKVASLRRRLAGGVAGFKARQPVGFKAALKAVPPPVVAGFGAFLVILALAIIFMPGGERSPAEAESAAADAHARAAGPAITQNAPTAPPAPALRVHTFPAPTRQEFVAPSPRPQPESEKKPPSVEPLKLPSLRGADLKVVPATKPPADIEKPPAATAKPEANAAPDEPEPVRANPGANRLAEAIRLHSQGRSQEAIGAAQQAIALYQADIEAGKNVESSKRAVANAKKLVTVWQQSLVEE